MSVKELSYSDIAKHNSQKSLYLILHHKVYDCSSFATDHPGGEDFLLELAGQDASAAFEGVGHSEGALEILEGLYIANLKRMPGELAPPSHVNGHPSHPSTSSHYKSSDGIIFSIFSGLIGALFVYAVFGYLLTPAAVENYDLGPPERHTIGRD